MFCDDLGVPGGEDVGEVGVDLGHAGHPLPHLHVDAHVGEHSDDLDHHVLEQKWKNTALIIVLQKINA